VPSRSCHQCGAAIALADPIPRDAECAGCGADVRSCLNCRHYDPAFNNSCRETEADPVVEKARRNFCEYFAFRPGVAAMPGSVAARQAEARRKLEELFKPKGKGGA
jgi:hypothetical protein